MKAPTLFLCTLLVGGLATLTVSACGEDAVAVQACVPSDVNPSLFCDVTYCSDNVVVNAECEDFYDACASSGVSLEECVGGALDVCRLETDPSSFCNVNYCSADASLQEQCSEFFEACLALSPDPNDAGEECAAGAIHQCQEQQTGNGDANVFCDENVCSEDVALQQECTATFEACMASEGQRNYDECIVQALLTCRRG